MRLALTPLARYSMYVLPLSMSVPALRHSAAASSPVATYPDFSGGHVKLSAGFAQNVTVNQINAPCPSGLLWWMSAHESVSDVI